MNRCLRLCAALLCLFLLLPAPAVFAEEDPVVDTVVTEGALDADALTEAINTYRAENSLENRTICVGVILPDTGDEYYYNGDRWMHSASLYKVPLMMIYTEKLVAGEITEDTRIGGAPFSTVLEKILVNSNNGYSDSAAAKLGVVNARKQYKTYAPDLPDDYYSPAMVGNSFFSCRFMSHIMLTLYNEPERFPGVTDCLLRANPEGYLHLTMGDTPVAQKYGAHEQLHHVAAIVYTDRPVIITLMTYRVHFDYEQCLSELGAVVAETAVGVDFSAEPTPVPTATPEPTPTPTPVPTATPGPTPTPTPEAVEPAGISAWPYLAGGGTLLVAAAVILLLLDKKSLGGNPSGKE